MSFFDFLIPTLTVSPKSLTMPVGSSAKLSINRRASFASIAPHIASVDSGGQVTARSSGAATILVTDLETQRQVLVPVAVGAPPTPTPTPPSSPTPLTLEARVDRIEKHLGLS